MATAETVTLSLPHEPKEHSIKAFNRIETILKKELQHMRHEHNSEICSYSFPYSLYRERITQLTNDNHH